MNSKPGSSKEPDTNVKQIAGILTNESKQGINKLDQLTSDEIDKFISSETLAQYEYSGDRHLLIYDRNQIEESSVSSDADLGDEFFELSTGEAKKLLRDIIRTRDQLENGQLMTKAMRDLNSAKRTLATLHQYNYSVVRLHLPSGLVLQALFKPLESMDKVRAYFQQMLERPDLDFYIYFTPPKTILHSSSTLLDLRCVPTANFYLGVNGPSCERAPQVPPTPKTMENIGHDTRSEARTANQADVTGETMGDSVKLCSNEKAFTNGEEESIEGNTGPIDAKDSSVMDTLSADFSQSSRNGWSQESAVRYVRADVVAKYLVAKSVADTKAAQFRRAKNPALSFMNEPDPCSLTHCSKSPPEQSTPTASTLNRPRTSADKIPKWFKPGGK